MSAAALFDTITGVKKLRIAYYTAAVTGSGNTVLGIAIWNALRRAAIDCEFVMVGTLGMPELAEAQGIRTLPLGPETFESLSEERFRTSNTFSTLQDLAADILIVNLAWFTTHRIVQDLPGRSVLLLRQVAEEFFGYVHNDRLVELDPSVYGQVVAIEPWPLPFPALQIDPIVMRNADELLPRASAAAALGLDPNQPTALIATNGKPGEYEELCDTYSYLEDQYQLYCSSNHYGGVFPIVDYFNAFDFIVCSAGYNAFWEAVYLEKPAVFVPNPRRFEDQSWRIKQCQEYRFSGNGADQLVRRLLQEPAAPL